jgi:arginine-tRNA-protein transferase
MPLPLPAPGGRVHPHCWRCRARAPARVAVDKFRPIAASAAARRNADLELVPEPAARATAGSSTGDISTPPLPAVAWTIGREDFTCFLYTPRSRRASSPLPAGRLAIAVTDFASTGLSAVYTFFDPSEPYRGLGTYAILRQIELARDRHLPHVYLGYWIENHPKMDYKARFKPLELLGPEGWQTLARSAGTVDA